jgi:hypothetical protein|tara:strand:+ start:1123 stop:1506 length:384 start_codon:yes stop_codon:yes gene_type:complete
MNQLFIGIIVVLGMGGYFLYQENITLTANNIKLEGAVEEQKETLRVVQESFAVQTESLQNMSRRNNEIEQEKSRYLEILSKHNFERLATVKPGLMENRFNKGTVDVLEGIENDTKNISNLDTSTVNK